jgi:transcriptional regulator with XRE-family HTH domain
MKKRSVTNKTQNGQGDLAALGQRIFETRKKKGITLDELSLRMQISKGNLSDIERGKRDPRFQTLKAIAEGLGLKLQALIKDL